MIKNLTKTSFRRMVAVFIVSLLVLAGSNLTIHAKSPALNSDNSAITALQSPEAAIARGFVYIITSPDGPTRLRLTVTTWSAEN
jgi:hypothetical protein